MISVIIPTRLADDRSNELLRAIASIRAQQGVAPTLIVVANGPRISPALKSGLIKAADVRYLELPQPGLRRALPAGRRAVTTPFFCFLDDDDEYLPGALSQRLLPMLQDERLDAVAGCGYRIEGGRQYPSGRRTPLDADPLLELTRHNWLTSCGAVYRSSRVGEEFFADLPAWCEWTSIAWRLCLSRRVGFIGAAGHLIHDTPGSLSKSDHYGVAQSAALARILQLQVPPAIRPSLRRQYGRALHDAAEQHRRGHALRAAWAAHLKSLATPGGWRYLSFTRKLLAP